MSAADVTHAPGRRRRAGPARVAWLLSGSVFAAAALGFGTLNVVSLLAHERTRVHTEFPQVIRLVELRVSDGSVTVQGADAVGATVDATISDGLRAAHHSETVEGERLIVRSSCPGFVDTWCSADYRLTVPRGVSLVARGADGSITVSGLSGDIDLSSSNGGLHVDGSRAALTLHTSDGSVTATNAHASAAKVSTSDGSILLTFASAPADIEARTSDGSITIEVPDDGTAYDVRATVSDGHTTTAVRTDPTSPHVIDAHTSDGSITVRYAGAG